MSYLARQLYQMKRLALKLDNSEIDSTQLWRDEWLKSTRAARQEASQSWGKEDRLDVSDLFVV